MAPFKDILQRLAEGPVIGDGGFIVALERRGYVKAGPWSPEATVEHPEAVRQLHREFLRAGSDVMQTFTFYASDDKLEKGGDVTLGKPTGQAINQAACDIAREVASEGEGIFVAGGITKCESYLDGKGKKAVQDEFRKQVKIFVENKVDFMIVEYFEHIEEMEWAIEVCTEIGLPIAATMCIGPEGDQNGVSTGECAVRMARAGASVVGVNCHYDPQTALQSIRLMKEALDKANLKPFLMTQPVAYHTPDADKNGFMSLPEFPFALEPRLLTRWDAQRYAREAYNLGVRYIGGCCGFEPYHIRAIAEELSSERGKRPAGSTKHDSWGEALATHPKPYVRSRAARQHWETLRPATGRPLSSAFSIPDH